MRYVIGSGPSGIMCASALLDAGYEVTILDVGHALPESAISIAEKLAEKDIDLWTNDDIEKARGSTVISPGGIPQHRSFGSDFAHAKDADLDIDQEDCDYMVSHAKGGFSTIWGGSVLPNRAEDFEEWPVTLQEMIPHYKAVGDIMGIAASVNDPLIDWFPNYAEPLPAARRSSQANHLFEKYKRHATVLARRGLLIGESRLALRTRPDRKGRVCRNAGLCLTGCPFSAIYSTDQTLEVLMENGKFHYLAGYQVKRLEEHADAVTIRASRLEDGSMVTFAAERVYLGCGALATAMIVAASLPGRTLSLPMVYQPYFLIPLVLLKNFPRITSERLHTLSQLNIEIDDEKISPRTLHLQLYTFNHFIAAKLESLLRIFPFIRDALRQLMLGRIVTLQGYAFGDDSAPIRVEFERTSPDTVKTSLRGQPDRGRLSSLASSTIRKLTHSFWELGMVPVPFMHILGEPGVGSHAGSLFPMREHPGSLETDRLGRIPGHPRVHLIDGSVLTTIPSTTITYSIMANAHRIGAESASL